LKKIKKNPKEKCKRLLHLLAKQETDFLKSIGMTAQTITLATSNAEQFIDKNGEQTEKQLSSLFLASIYITQNDLALKSKSSFTKITDRSLYRNFGVDRKTIRKWKKVF
jgi:hypothetical protein